MAVLGGGAAGLSAAWLLAKRHRVTLLERDGRLGGHAHTAKVTDSTGRSLDIDTGFIVYNEPCYPNLARWFETLEVKSVVTDMSFAVSREGGRFEYAGGPPLGLLAQPSLLLRPRFWSMLAGLSRFYREARRDIPGDATVTLGDYLASRNYSRAFVDDHLLPFAAAIWSSPGTNMLDYPAAAFIRFCDNHGLLQLSDRPLWRTVSGGSHAYVEAVGRALGTGVITGFEAVRVERGERDVTVHASDGRRIVADQLVLAVHADQALRCLERPDALERELLSPFGYESNLAVLHTDSRFLPRRRHARCSWNYVEGAGGGVRASISYWMNRLQHLDFGTDFIVTLNPDPLPPESMTRRTVRYEHPVFTPSTFAAQQRLWTLQGRRRTWFCGSYFGAGFHEDAVQSGFAVAEQLGAPARPWRLDEPSSRIVLDGTSPKRGSGPRRDGTPGTEASGTEASDAGAFGAGTADVDARPPRTA